MANIYYKKNNTFKRLKYYDFNASSVKHSHNYKDISTNNLVINYYDSANTLNTIYDKYGPTIISPQIEDSFRIPRGTTINSDRSIRTEGLINGLYFSESLSLNAGGIYNPSTLGNNIDLRYKYPSLKNYLTLSDFNEWLNLSTTLFNGLTPFGGYITSNRTNIIFTVFTPFPSLPFNTNNLITLSNVKINIYQGANIKKTYTMTTLSNTSSPSFEIISVCGSAFSLQITSSTSITELINNTACTIVITCDSIQIS